MIDVKKQPEYIFIDSSLRLRKYDGQAHLAFSWYQDPEVSVVMKDKIIIISSIILISSNFRTVIFLIDKVKMSFRQINKPSRVIRCSCIYSQEHPIIIQTFVSVIFQISPTYQIENSF